MSISARCLLAALALAALAGGLRAEEIRDFYAEPGLHPFKERIGYLNESVDPFSGALHLSHSDITVPGNGGMDIEISRFYTSPQDNLEWADGIMGIGWTMHFGRIVVPAAHAGKVCSQALFATSTKDNPSIEHSDGARELLVLATDGSGDLVTKSYWRARCNDQEAIEVRSPDGRTYLMDAEAASEDGQNRSWYTTRITDLHGNGIGSPASPCRAATRYRSPGRPPAARSIVGPCPPSSTTTASGGYASGAGATPTPARSSPKPSATTPLAARPSPPTRTAPPAPATTMTPWAG